MRAIYILGEGSTEEEFVNQILRPYFFEKGIADTRCILMNTSPGHRGGGISFGRYKHNAERILSKQRDIILTSLIDFFRLSTDFPGYKEAKETFPSDRFQQVGFLEGKLLEYINHKRFIPYIQLHEFESLLFSSSEGFESIPELPFRNKTELISAVNQYQNPEMLNDGETTAPSKRLERLIPGYQKNFDGPFLAKKITLPRILERCDRFREWTELLIESFHNSSQTNL